MDPGGAVRVGSASPGSEPGVTMPSGRSQPAQGWFVLIAGWPGSGKSTLGAALAAELGLPLLAKDEIKEALMEGLGLPDTVAASRRLGKAAVLAMLRASRPAHRGALHRTARPGACPVPCPRRTPSRGAP